MSELAGKTALVTGTAHGIGAAIAATLERMGARVAGEWLGAPGAPTVPILVAASAWTAGDAR